jgi:hypothetical protein
MLQQNMIDDKERISKRRKPMSGGNYEIIFPERQN